MSDPGSKPLEEGFSDKEKQSSEKVYPAFEKQNMASSLLHSIGAFEPKKCVDSYKEKTVELRKLIIDFETSDESPNTEKCKEIAGEIEKIRNELDTIKDCFFKKIRDFNDEIKNKFNKMG